MSNQHETYWHTNYPRVTRLLAYLHDDFTAIEVDEQEIAEQLAEIAMDFADQYQEAGNPNHDTATTDDQVLEEWVAQTLGYKTHPKAGTLTS